MWRIVNRTPYAAERNWTRDKRGMHAWIVVVRGTYRIGEDGRLELEDEQPPPPLEPEYFGEPGTSSLRMDSDLLAEKPSTDVIVNGSAFAPRGQPAPSVPVVLRVGKLEKQLIVHGGRVYVDGSTGLRTTSPRPFLEQPIVYEHAYGGADLTNADPTKQALDERNPVGRGYPPKPKLWVNQAAHAIEYPNQAITKGPAGFGAIDRGWLPRRKLAGTYDKKWIENKSPLLPDDYDSRFTLCAPADQRSPVPLQGGERIGVLNMTPQGPLVFELPRVSLRFTTLFGSRRQSHGQRVSSVVVEPTEKRVSVFWQTAIRVPAPQVDYLDETRVEEA